MILSASHRPASPLGSDLTFERFFREEVASVVALCHALSGSRHAAEDIAQEAFLAAYRRWDEIGRYDDPAAWVRRVAMNVSVSLVRRKAAEVRAMLRLRGREARTLPQLGAESVEFWRIVRSLPRRQGQVVALYYMEDRSIDDIASVLQIAPGTVKALLHQARAALAARMGHEDEEER